MELPCELTARATLRGREFSWRLEDFPAVLAKARSLGYGCLGGQFQFRAPSGTCEMYWLNADSEERRPGEPWSEFAAHSCSEVLERFNALVATTDFLAEAKRWFNVPEISGPETQPLDYLCFVAYFVLETEVSNSSFKPKSLGGST